MQKVFPAPLAIGTRVYLACQQAIGGEPQPLNCRACARRAEARARLTLRSVFVKMNDGYYCVKCNSRLHWDPENKRFKFWITPLTPPEAEIAKTKILRFPVERIIAPTT